MGEIVPWRQITQSKELREVDKQTRITKAAEDGRAEVVEQRINNGLNMAQRVTMRITQLDTLIGGVIHERPHLEMELRTFESMVTNAVAITVMQYLMK